MILAANLYYTERNSQTDSYLVILSSKTHVNDSSAGEYVIVSLVTNIIFKILIFAFYHTCKFKEV